MQQNWVQLVLIIATINWLVQAQTGEDVVNRIPVVEAQANLVHSAIGLVGLYAAWTHFNGGS